MPTAGTTPLPRWIADVTGLILAVLAIGAIVYLLGVKAHVWQSPSGGFWIS